MKQVTLSKENILGLIAIGLFVLMSISVPGFLSSNNLTNMMFQLPEFGLFALAMMVVIVTGGIDLSITYTAALAGVAIAILSSNGYPMIIAILGGIAVGLLCGFMNGFIIAKIGVSPILVTLGTMVLFEGLILSITKGNSISGFSPEYTLIGNGYYLGLIPLSIIIFLFVAILTSVLLNKTVWGRSVYMVGSNPVASLFSGVNNSKVLMKVYLYSALLAAIASIIMTSRYNTVKVDLGSSYLLQSVAAAVLGGTEIQGGYGKVIGTLYAVMIFQMISSGLNLMGVPRPIVTVIMGVILIAVLIINFIKVKADENKQKKLAETA
ncbi:MULTISPECIES: ABC transporter permease [Aeribacillus]|jgi:simple sugar transport system permease protein/ribose transport system permease protein|uniref:ABC transporter permease n=1 Tax=Aeribacillus TaxID=1055323 RepID=UPI000E34E84F|nr:MULTISPECIES: ABC transporter permease [Aeribacillus]MDR9797458.1 ABC transporter permease [Aeribacillus pallidus]MED0716198.1 ABC transporter permease [Aeribacillus composti]MED0746483.1 ABC transporter permease [Aeribacillus composti]MED1441015.1 ABC transporter permease [Aeribacillus composti]RZI50102.1 ABC transporter permease [Aeribacillus pallidus]